jgi:hypothetical protein
MAQNGTNFSGVELPEGLGEKELRWSYWWVNHRDDLRKRGIALFAVVDLVLLGIGIWGFVDYLALSGVQEERNIRQMASAGRKIGAGEQVREISLSEPLVFSATGDRYDLLAPVENPNLNYAIELHYRFVIGETETPLRKGFVLPGQSKFLAEIGVQPVERPSGANVTLKVEKRLFRHLDAHEVRDFEAFTASHLDIEAVDQVFTPAVPGATVPVSKTAFVLENRTAYSYYDVDLLVLLYRGDSIVAATRYQLDRLRGAEKRPIELFWYQSLPQVTAFKVVPDINILDPDVYRQPGT